jgi:membrane protease YdiL (CAAX protease family)
MYEASVVPAPPRSEQKVALSADRQAVGADEGAEIASRITDLIPANVSAQFAPAVELTSFALAQAEPLDAEVTGGQAAAGFLLMLAAAASMGMMTLWVVRLGQTGHTLPAANRRPLRAPLPLTILAIALSLLMLMMTLLDSMIVEDPVPSVPMAQTSAVKENAPDSAGPAQESPPDSTKDGTPPIHGPDSANPASDVADAGAPDPADPEASEQMTPTQMLRALQAQLIFDVFLLALFGVATLASQVRPAEPGSRATPLAPAGLQAALGELPVAHNPFAPIPENAFAANDFPVPRTDDQPDAEPVSITTELRYAGEIFLASWLPTAVLRMIIVVISMGISGEEPPQHPFLEMLDSGAGMLVMGLIVVTAVLMAPIVEELQYRVLVFGGIAQLGRPKLALLLSSLLFAGAHGFPDSIALLPLAVALGYAYHRRRSYLTVIFVHFIFNAFNTAFALLALL